MILAGIDDPKLRGRFRQSGILNTSWPLDFDAAPAERSAALSYIEHVAPGIDFSRLIPGALRRHPRLMHWASRGGMWPALLARAENTDGKLLHATFLLRDTLAPIPDPRLLLGAACGACCELAVARNGATDLWITETVDDALRVLARGDDGAVWSALSVPNLKKVRVPEWVARVNVVMRTCADGEWGLVRDRLAAQGAHVVPICLEDEDVPYRFC